MLPLTVSIVSPHVGLPANQLLISGTGQNLFVTDGMSQIGSSVSIALNQSTIQTVTNLQHVSYFDINGAEVDYLYVFGSDAQGVPYFGVVRLRPAAAIDANSVATALNSMEVRAITVNHRFPEEAPLFIIAF